MKISAAYNWDYDVLKAYSKLDVQEVFAAPSKALLGSGRTETNAIDLADIKNHICKAKDYGIGFNFLINTTYVNDSISENEIINYLREIENLSPDIVTIAHPKLIQLASNHICIPIKISVNAHLKDKDSIEAYPYNLGKRINLDTIINRDFASLSYLRENIKKDLELLANQGCIHNCAFRDEHNRLCSISSSTIPCISSTDIRKQEMRFLRYCFTERITNPDNLIKAYWIRPEDIDYYGKMGFDIKIAGRQKSSEWLINTVRAYSERCYNGNLIDLICLSREEIVFGKQKGNGFIIDNNILSKENFIDHILSKDHSEAFYQYITKKAVSILDPEKKISVLEAL